MKYACLVYLEEAAMDKMTAREWDALNSECMDFGAAVDSSGHRVGGEPLQPISTATTVRVRNGKVTTTDGPFAETKEQLAGFYLFDAKDLDEAIRLASRIPPARLGSIEVRPVRELKRSGNRGDHD